MSKLRRYLFTALVVLAAVSAVVWKYRDYIVNPWTRNGQITATVVQVAPRVSGPIVELPIVDDQTPTHPALPARGGALTEKPVSPPPPQLPPQPDQ